MNRRARNAVSGMYSASTQHARLIAAALLAGASLFGATSCGAVAPSGDGGADSAADDGSASDVSPGCDPSKPFGTPMLLDNINDPSSDNTTPRLTPDELTIYFDSSRVNGTPQIYFATRATTSQPFGAPEVVAGISTPDTNATPTVTPDQLGIFWASSRAGGVGGYDVWGATRTSSSASFANVTSLVAVNSPTDDGDPFLRADGQELWFTSIRLRGEGNGDIFRAPASAGSFANPVPVAELNGPTMNRLPALSSDGLTAFWSTDRTDATVAGGLDIWTAHRASLSAPFTGLAPVKEVNSIADEYMGSVSSDGCRIYFSSARAGFQGIYMATRP